MSLPQACTQSSQHPLKEVPSSKNQPKSNLTGMANWDKDKFMSEWDKKYVSTNVKTGSRPYDREFFLELHSVLVSTQEGELKSVAACLIVSLDFSIA